MEQKVPPSPPPTNTCPLKLVRQLYEVSPQSFLTKPTNNQPTFLHRLILINYSLTEWLLQESKAKISYMCFIATIHPCCFKDPQRIKDMLTYIACFLMVEFYYCWQHFPKPIGVSFGFCVPYFRYDFFRETLNSSLKICPVTVPNNILKPVPHLNMELTILIKTRTVNSKN
jgi:hypothetical protein